MSASEIFAFLAENDVSADTFAIGFAQFAKKKHNRAELERLAKDRLLPAVHNLSPRGISTVVSTCSRVGMLQSPVVVACLAELPGKVHSIDARGIATILNCVSKMKNRSEALATMNVLLS